MFNGVTNQFYTTRLPFRADCLSHETYPAPVALPMGTTISMRYTYDNSAANVRNPRRPPVRVVWGQNTSSTAHTDPYPSGGTGHGYHWH